MSPARFFIPRGLNFKSGKGDDDIVYTVTVTTKQQFKDHLSFIFAVLRIDGSPRALSNEFIHWSKRELRSAKDGTVFGREWMGETEHGGRWRSVYFPFGLAEYTDADAHSAAVFNQILDGMCLEQKK